jgi:hypothetical protein
VQDENIDKQKNQGSLLRNPDVHIIVRGCCSRSHEHSSSKYSDLYLFMFFMHGHGDLDFLLWVFQGTAHDD